MKAVEERIGNVVNKHFRLPGESEPEYRWVVMKETLFFLSEITRWAAEWREVA